MKTLTCKKTYYHPYNFTILFKDGQLYDIEMIRRYIFSDEVTDRYFITIKETRKLKLEKLNEIYEI